MIMPPTKRNDTMKNILDNSFAVREATFGSLLGAWKKWDTGGTIGGVAPRTTAGGAPRPYHQPLAVEKKNPPVTGGSKKQQFHDSFDESIAELVFATDEFEEVYALGDVASTRG